MRSPLGGRPPSERMVLRSSSIVPGLKRQNSDLRNQGSNQFRNNATCATPIFRLKLLVLLTCSPLVVEPLTLWPHLNELHPIFASVLYFCALCTVELVNVLLREFKELP